MPVEESPGSNGHVENGAKFTGQTETRLSGSRMTSRKLYCTVCKEQNAPYINKRHVPESNDRNESITSSKLGRGW